MKRMMIRILALGLVLFVSTGAAAQSMDDVAYTMGDKLMKQLHSGSGFVGTLTLTATALEGREDEAFSTVKPLVMDFTYITVPDTSETRVKLALNASDYQQGNAEISILDSDIYMRSSLLDDGWYMLGDSLLTPALTDIGVADAAPGLQEFSAVGGVLPGMLSFLTGMGTYLLGADTSGLSASMEQYTTKIDFWLEGYRDSVEMIDQGDGTSLMEIYYSIPPAAVKSQLKQLLIDMMGDDALLQTLRGMMPKEQADLFLTPALQPYYFYAVDELPLQADLTVRRLLSFQGDTQELFIEMPLFDSQTGAMMLTYTRRLGEPDMPDENTISLAGEDSLTELTYHTYETMNGTTVYQGTLWVENAAVDGAKPPILWADFDLSSRAVTTKDLNGYETLNQSLTLVVSPAERSGEEDAAAVVAFSKTDLSLDMQFASLSDKKDPTNVGITLQIASEGMAQTLLLELEGTTTGRWTPEAFDPAEAIDPATLPAEELEQLLSSAVIRGGLLFLPYINLPKIDTNALD